MPLGLRYLRKSENGISVRKTFELNRSNCTGVVLNCKSDADKLRVKLNNEVPSKKVEKVSTRTPSITVVGLKREYTKEEFLSMMTKQNPGITALIESSDTCPKDKEINFIAVKPLKNNQSMYNTLARRFRVY